MQDFTRLFLLSAWDLFSKTSLDYFFSPLGIFSARLHCFCSPLGILLARLPAMFRMRLNFLCKTDFVSGHLHFVACILGHDGRVPLLSSRKQRYMNLDSSLPRLRMQSKVKVCASMHSTFVLSNPGFVLRKFSGTRRLKNMEEWRRPLGHSQN